MQFNFIPSFKISIPFLLIIFAGLLGISYLYINLPQSGQTVETQYKQRLYRNLSRTQGNSEYLLQKNDQAGVRREIASLASDPDNITVILTDENQTVIASTQRALFDKPLSYAFPEINNTIAQQVTSKRNSHISISTNRQILTGYISVNFGANVRELRPNRMGLIIIQQNLSIAKNEARSQILNQSLYWFGFILIMALFLAFIFHFLLTRRARKLIVTTEKFSQGELDIRSNLTGSDELAQLSHAFDQMAENFSQTQNRLVEDMQQRKHVEINLRESEASYRALFNANEDSVFVHDPETGAILDVNLTACESYGYSVAEFSQLNVGDISSGVEPYTLEHAAQLIRTLKDNKPITFEWRAKHKDGSLQWNDVCLKKAVIAGQPRVLGFTRDITERKKTEAAQQQLESQLRQAQKMESIGQLTGGIAHDFNNILTSILGNTDLSRELLNPQLDPKISKYLNNILRSGHRARDLIKQMLTFSRGQHSKTSVLHLAPLIDETTKLMRSTLPSSMELHVNIAATVSTVRSDPVQIEQILTNLYINARDAMQGQGRVTIFLNNKNYQQQVCSSCQRSFSGEFVELAVKDNGGGISQQTLERIFEPFYTTKEVGKGSGMGLSMVHGIVHKQGGHIIVGSVLSKGSTFHMLFPAVADEQVTEPVTDQLKPALSSVRKKIDATVLLVDDEQKVTEFMTDLLQSRGMNVISMTNSEHALTAFKGAPQAFDLVITDQTMPKLTGMELAAQLLLISPKLPIILYTGHSEHLSEESVKQQGIKSFLKKPVEIETLITTIDKLLNKAEST